MTFYVSELCKKSENNFSKMDCHRDSFYRIEKCRRKREMWKGPRECTGWAKKPNLFER